MPIHDHKNGFLVLGAITALTCVCAQAKDPIEFQDIYSLPLEQLVKIKVDVSGYAIQALQMDLRPITANPFNTNIFESSKAIEIIDSKTIEARGLRNVVDVVDTVPGVLYGESPSEPYSFSFRGFSGDSIGVLYDGISMGRSTLNMRPLGTNNLERVEIVRGAGDLLYEGAAGGIINLLPKRASTSNTQHLQNMLLSYGDYDESTFAVELSGPLGEATSYLFNVDYRTSEGWVDESDSMSLNINSSVNFDISSDLNATISLDYFSDELPSYWGTPLVPRDDAREPVSVVDSNQSNLVIDEQTRFTNYNVKDNTIESESYWFITDLKWRVSDSTNLDTKLYLYDADRLWENAETYNYDQQSGLVERDRLLVEHERELLGVKTDLKQVGSVFGKTNSSVFSLQYRDLDFTRDVGFEPVNFFVDFVDFQDPERGNFDRSLIDTRTDSYTEKRIVLVAENQLSLNKNLLWDIGVRYEKIDFTRMSENFDGSERENFGDDHYQSSFRMALNYQLSKKMSYFYQMSRTRDSFANSAIVYGGAANKSELDEVQAGIRFTNSDNTLESSANIFNMRQRREVITTPNYNNDTYSTGVELKLHYKVTPNANVGVDASWIEAEFGHFIDTNSNESVTGNTPVNVPDRMFGLWTTYNNIGGLPIEIGGNVKRVSARWADTENTVELNGYTLFNMFIAYTGKQYRVGLYGRNLTDEIYAQWSDVFYPNQVTLGRPRSFDVNFRYYF